MSQEKFSSNRILRQLMMLGVIFQVDFLTLKQMDVEELILFLEMCEDYLAQKKLHS